MSTDAYRRIIAAAPRDRLDLFLATANRIGAPVGNVEKDFWVCWTLNALYHERPAGEPRLLFKGGTSLSKGYDLIKRFSEDIDVTVFRDDLEEPASVEDLEALSNKKRRTRLDTIRNACRTYITGPLNAFLAAQLADVTSGTGRVEVDDADPDGQSLLVWYPEVEPRDGAYVRPAIRLESGGKSALDPHGPLTIIPYVAEEAADIDLAVPEVTTIEATRTFWDKVVIAHGLRRWFERRGELRQEGQRVSRHYYDLHCLVQSEIGKTALADLNLVADCVRHARMFFDRPDYDLASAVPGSFAIEPTPKMVDALTRDYANTTAMIFGAAPSFENVMASAGQIERALNAGKWRADHR
ncbi:MAG: nucleotidyl transferase AbiEii/AbiGii toxin family protein [Rhizobiaceae bacterium]|nr:nucleotidyl transferase AbiEii/AbiGii toxin family protein [Rhizobiaceae bacterium]